jgi:hypothetical protein
VIRKPVRRGSCIAGWVCRRRCSALRDFANTHNLAAAACRRSSAHEVLPFAVLLLPAGEGDVDRRVG